MVQAIENWCCVTGIVEKVERPSAQAKGKSDQVALLVKIERVKPVDNFPTLLSGEVATISIIVRQSQITDAKPNGHRVAVPVRVAGPDRYFAHPDWSLARGSLMCGAN